MRRHLTRHAEHHRQHAFRQPRIDERARHFERGARRFLGGLHDAGAAGAERRADLARRIADREIPRREAGDRADGLLHHRHAHAGVAAAAARARRRAGPLRRTSRRCPRPAPTSQRASASVLPSSQRGDARDALGALAHAGPRPCAESCRARAAPARATSGSSSAAASSARSRSAVFACGSFAERFAGGGVDHRLPLAIALGDPFAGDEQLQLGVGAASIAAERQPIWVSWTDVHHALSPSAASRSSKLSSGVRYRPVSASYRPDARSSTSARTGRDRRRVVLGLDVLQERDHAGQTALGCRIVDRGLRPCPYTRCRARWRTR